MAEHKEERTEISWLQVCARRLERHALAVPSPDSSPAGITRAICAVHAQIMSAAELSIGLRLAGGTREDIHHALWTEHSLIKTRGPRGTVHLLAAQDLPMWTGALSALPPSPNPYPEDVRMTPEQTEYVIQAIGDALEDAELTVGELTEAIVARTGAWAGDPVIDAFQDRWPRWRQIEDTVAKRGVLCFGPNRGRRVTYTNPRRWMAAFQPDDGDTALATLVKRYLYAYGPASPQHFARWLNVSPRWSVELFESLLDQLVQVQMEGRPSWLAADDLHLPSTPPSGVRLLPYFDAYAVGCYPRELVFPGKAQERALAGGQAGNFQVLLVDGVAAGIWHQRRSGKKLEITVEPFGELSAAQRKELDAQVERLGEFLEGKPHLTIGTVTSGPHA